MLTPWKKNYDKPRKYIKKQRHYFANKGPSSHSYGFSSSHVWMWELDCEESWALKKLMLLELWCWRILLRVPWTERRSNQSILKEINSEYSLQGPMLKLQLQSFGHLMQRTDSFEKTLMLGNIEAGGEGGDRGWDGCMASLTQVWVTQTHLDMSLSKLQELVMDREAWHASCPWCRKESDMTEWLNWLNV